MAALALALLAAVALRPSIRGNDGVGNYVYAASILRGGDLDFRDEYRLFDQIQHDSCRFSSLPTSPVTGRPSNRYGVGAAMTWAPFLAVMHATLRLTRPNLADGVSRPYEWAVGVGTAWWGSLGLWLLYRRLREGWGAPACAMTIAGLVLATPLGFYLYAHGSMSHGTGFFAATCLALAFDRAWRRPDAPHAWATLAGVGASASLLVVTRFQDAPWAILACGALAWRWIFWTGGYRPEKAGAIVRSSSFSLSSIQGDSIDSDSIKNEDKLKLELQTRPSLMGLVALALAGFFVALPQLAAWKVLYGSWLSGPLPYLDPTAGAGEFSRWPTHLIDALVSERHGALAWHPILVVALAWTALVARRERRWRAWAVLGLTGFVALAWVVGSWSMWWAGASFGNRFFIGALPFLAPGLAAFFEAGGRRGRRVLAAGLLAALVAWNMGLLYQYATEMVPREDPVPWSRVIRQNVIDVPRRLPRMGK
jgi:hypothetical protein